MLATDCSSFPVNQLQSVYIMIKRLLLRRKKEFVLTLKLFWYFSFSIGNDVQRAVHQFTFLEGNPDMCLSARALSSFQKLKERELHLNGGKWGRMLSRAQLFAPLRHTHKPQ